MTLDLVIIWNGPTISPSPSQQSPNSGPVIRHQSGPSFFSYEPFSASHITQSQSQSPPNGLPGPLWYALSSPLWSSGKRSVSSLSHMASSDLFTATNTLAYFLPWWKRVRASYLRLISLAVPLISILGNSFTCESTNCHWIVCFKMVTFMYVNFAS